MATVRKRIAIFGLVLAALGLLASPSPLVAVETQFGGVGLQVVPTSGGELVVLKVVEGSPAVAAGMLPGDLIVQVDDFPLAGSDFTEVVSRYLWGKPGSAVTLVFLRPGETGRHSVTLRRAVLKPDAASFPPGVKMLTPGKK